MSVKGGFQLKQHCPSSVPFGLVSRLVLVQTISFSLQLGFTPTSIHISLPELFLVQICTARSAFPQGGSARQLTLSSPLLSEFLKE